MEKTLTKLTVSALLSTVLLMPVSALAYLSPDQVFNTPGGSETHGAASDESPSAVQSEQVTKRSAPDVVEQQQLSAAEARAQAQQSLQPIDAEPVDTYEAPLQSIGLFDQNAQYERRQERKQDAGGPTIVIAGNGDVIDGNGNVLHSGAPLVTSTGPETILAALAIVLAMICTFAYVHVRSRMTGCAVSA